MFRELRRRHNVEASRASAEHRLARLDELVSLARSIGGRAGHSGSDEPIELWLRMKSRFRHPGGGS